MAKRTERKNYYKCPSCGKVKHVNAFYGTRGDSGDKIPSPYCKKCSAEKTKAYLASLSNDVKSLRGHTAGIKHRYGVTRTEWDTMFARQGGKCAICGKPQNGRRLDVDHNHETGQVRQLICSQCNAGLGMLKDNTNLVNAASSYLTYHNNKAKEGTKFNA